MYNVMNWLPALLLSVSLLGFAPLAVRAENRDPLPDVKARLAIEAQRVEKEFAEGRAAAYKLVRGSDPRLLEATEKLETLLAMVRADNALDTKRREVLIVTLKWDLGKVKEIAGERRRLSPTTESPIRTVQTENRRVYEERRTTDRQGTAGDARSIIESRNRALADARGDRANFGDRFNRTMKSVHDSALPESRAYVLPDDWREKSRKRSTAQKLTPQEAAILKALNKVIDVDFDKHELEEVLEWFRKTTGATITIDKRSMDEAGVTYKTPISLKLRASTRTVLKRMLSDLNMAYVIKGEAIQITTIERAKQMTTTRTYYVGDLTSVVDIRLNPITSKLLMLQMVNQLINTITSTIDSNSWKVNNPDAVGTISFNPLTDRKSVV